MILYYAEQSQLKGHNMARQDRIGTHATKVHVESDGMGGEIVEVRYHSTTVYRKDPLGVTLYSGGWATATTKARMNQALAVYGPYELRVYQHRGRWFLARHGERDGQGVEFWRRVMVTANGEVRSDMKESGVEQHLHSKCEDVE